MKIGFKVKISSEGAFRVTLLGKYSLPQDNFLLKVVNTNSKTNMRARVDKRMRWLVKTATVKEGSKEVGQQKEDK